MEKNINLLPHNELAYKKVIECLQDNQLVAINHATGTGKSFIILKYLYENKDKRILYLSPSYAINSQLINDNMPELNINKDEFLKLDTMIYRNLLDMDMNLLVDKYDIVILDEYHRCGAKKWGIKINQLLENIKNTKPNVKVIGTTATEIRYLDNNKNMNNVLFDGVCASQLTLVDAIVDGILPVPIYYCFSNNCEKKLERLEKKILKLVGYEEDLEKYFSQISKIRKLIEIAQENEKDFFFNLEDVNKFLVFSSTVASISEDSKTIHSYLENKIDNEYKIYSTKGVLENNRIINEFRNVSKNQTSVLYSINLFNEGIHIKDVDAIFMMRETSSPIIYFQQIGRLLSYSRRKDRVYIFDCVDNISKNKVIYNLFNDISEKCKTLMKTDPNNKEKYEKILEKLKIVNNCSFICKELDKLSEMATEENLILERLKSGAKKIKQGEKDSYEYLQAIVDIHDYQKYITKELFLELSKLDIEKPELLKMTYEHFCMLLGDNNNIKETEKYYPKELMKKIDEFYKNFKYLPSIYSADEYEKNIAMSLLSCYEKLPNMTKKKLEKMCNENSSPIERVLYTGTLRKDENLILYDQITELLEQNIPLPIPIIIYLNEEHSIESDKLLNKVYNHNIEVSNLNNYSLLKNITYDNEENKQKNNEKILYSRNYLERYRKYRKNYEETEDKEEFLFSIAQEIFGYIKENFQHPKYGKNSYENELFFKSRIFAKELKQYSFLEELNKLILEKNLHKEQEKRKKFIKELKEFMENNSGCFPSEHSIIMEERQLAKKFKLYKGEFVDDIDKFNSEFSEVNKAKKIELIKKYIEFIKLNGKRPNVFSKNNEEKQLAIEFDRIRLLLDNSENIAIRRESKKIDKNKKCKQLLNEIIAESESKKYGG